MGNGNSPRAVSILSGVLLSAAAFALLLWALAWFADTPYAHFLSYVAIVFIMAGVALQVRRNGRIRN